MQKVSGLGIEQEAVRPDTLPLSSVICHLSSVIRGPSSVACCPLSTVRCFQKTFWSIVGILHGDTLDGSSDRPTFESTTEHQPQRYNTNQIERYTRTACDPITSALAFNVFTELMVRISLLMDRLTSPHTR